MTKKFSRRQVLALGATGAAVAVSGVRAAVPNGRSTLPPRTPAKSDPPEAATGGESRIPGHFAPFHKTAGVPPVKFFRESVPPHQVPNIAGEFEEAVVPDTCDLEQRARLFVDCYLNSITVPELDHEPFNRGRLNFDPPRLSLDTGSYDCALPKFRESLPLLRTMTGSKAGPDIDAAWAALTLKCIGPDGLFYDPRIGRPWDRIGAYAWAPQDVEYRAALHTGNGRLLGSLAIYYKLTGDEIWNKTAKGVVDRLNQLAVRVNGMAFFTRNDFALGYTPSKEEIQKAIASMSESRAHEAEWRKSAGETERNTALWQTWVITGLAQYYRVSGYEPAKDLAYALVNYLRRLRYIETWESHFHCITLGIHGMLELALATSDHELAGYARRAYDYAKEGDKTIAFPQFGFFTNAQVTYGGTPKQMPEPAAGAQPMEGCSIGDMTALAAKLTQLGMGDAYYEDIDRYVRNALTAIQRTHPAHSEVIFRKLREKGWTEAPPVEYTQLTDRLAERLIGSFATFSMPNDFWGARPDFDTCCCGNCSRAFYYAWESVVKPEKDALRVNLLLNRTSPWADIDSTIPYIGRVDIRVKKPAEALKVRMNDWIDKNAVRAAVEGAARPLTWQGNYAIIAPVKPGQKATFEFPIVEKTRTLRSHSHIFQATFRGNDVVSLSPSGDFYPLYQREHYRLEQPRYVKVRRFTCENPIDY